MAHGNDKVGAAVGIDEMVARVVGHEHVLQALAFGDAGGDAEHDTVAEGNDGRFHRRFVVLSVGYLFVAILEETGAEVLLHEVDIDDEMGYAEFVTLPARAGNLMLGVA